MEIRRATVVLGRRDTVSGNWTASPGPNPAEPATHPLSPAQHGPPYGMSTAVVGGVPTLQTDIPISAVLLALFACSAAAHMTILQLNKRAGLKFLFSGMLFVLSILRTIALSMRIVWATKPRAADIAIAAGILTQTGSVLVFVINLFLAQRVVRGYHPRFGWHPATNAFFIFLVACVVASLIMAIAVTVQSVLTLDGDIRRADRTVQLFAGTYMAVLSFSPIPIVLLAMVWPRKTHIERFGAGRWRTKVRILLFTTAVATLGTAFRIYTNYATRPATDPAWYHSRACYYCFNYVVDLVISATFLFSRFDRRFIVPNGAKRPGDYGKGVRDATITTTGAGAVGASSNKKGDDDDEKDGSNMTDPEKLAELNHSNEDIDSEKGHLPVCDDDEDDDEADLVDDDEKAPVRDKGKGKEVNVEGDEKGSSNDETPTQMYGPGGQWNGVPWPFRASWTAPRVFGPGQREEHEPLPSEPANHSRHGDGDSTEIGSSTDGSHSRSNSNSTGRGSRSGGGTSEEASSQWGGETSSTCIQEPEPAHLRTTTQQQQRSRSHHHHPHHPLHNHNNHNHNYLRPHSLQHSQSYVFGQALTSNDSIPMSADGPSSSTLSLSLASPTDQTPTTTTSVWPFTCERHYNDPVTQAGPSRSNSAAAAYHYRHSSSYAGGSSSSSSSAYQPSTAALFPGAGGDRGRMISRSRSCNVPRDKDRRAEAIAAATAAAEGAGGWI
ncbi:hypothetical protein GGR55DRAFT_79690 [Xylaria sp. FL0064]|nr:hypothetical protein GGR55DRAFT_79690 [Xylaria sp. FL0064]